MNNNQNAATVMSHIVACFMTAEDYEISLQAARRLLWGPIAHRDFPPVALDVAAVLCDQIGSHPSARRSTEEKRAISCAILSLYEVATSRAAIDAKERDSRANDDTPFDCHCDVLAALNDLGD